VDPERQVKITLFLFGRTFALNIGTPTNQLCVCVSIFTITAAFTLGMLYRIKIDDPPTTQALCVTPTRELAIQIFEKAVKPMAANMMGLKIQLAIAGTTIERGSPLNAHLVIGTPGKVVDWLKRRIINSKTVKVFVLDEADNMVAENGFRANSLLIKKAMPRECQTLLFSATFPEDVVKFADKMVYRPDKILIESEESLVRQLR
jgi:ATP-dependent RNA helicase DDX19/DBP5